MIFILYKRIILASFGKLFFKGRGVYEIGEYFLTLVDLILAKFCNLDEAQTMVF